MMKKWNMNYENKIHVKNGNAIDKREINKMKK